LSREANLFKGLEKMVNFDLGVTCMTPQGEKRKKNTLEWLVSLT
jgi:hypothetical protein